MKKFSQLLFIVIMAAFITGGTGLPFAGVLMGLALLTQLPLPKGVAFMAITYPEDCEEELTHTCDECEDPELARLRGVAFLDKDFAFSNPSSYTEWFNGIASGDIIIIPFTRGSFDGGTPKEIQGYGDQASKLIGYDYSATYFDPNYAVNRDFYNAIKRNRNKKFAFKTETLVHVTEVPCQVIPKAPVVDDITGEVVWEVMVKWSDDELPDPYTAPDGIFTCFAVS